MPRENELHLGFGTKKTCPFPLNRGVPSIEATDTKIIRTLFRDQILFWVPYTEMSLKAGCQLIFLAEKELITSSNWKENKAVWEF